ncbi:unnamed protein product [Didymodactylos carnosus]|uniref:Uncharacterized protein n=1 Tax=Didymodactylos carnosus TaxID=1234261 RepID=A0A814P4Y4_9BILA|nr:unnamed protein product [Didymodactylos carnosus]CAF1100829.1 unnamed protein product [Didymodactylos carnosus]CAF3829670.1 unnamed protein product [Didymodactylos carnosus]CAF3865741.1 unnamed protein product [Didymodactylos carnosus]
MISQSIPSLFLIVMTEGAFAAITGLLVAGLAQPRLAALFGLLYIVGREVYNQGYRRAGSKGRRIGAGILDLSLIVLWGMALYTCFSWGGGISGFLRLFKF